MNFGCLGIQFAHLGDLDRMELVAPPSGVGLTADDGATVLTADDGATTLTPET